MFAGTGSAGYTINFRDFPGLSASIPQVQTRYSRKQPTFGHQPCSGELSIEVMHSMFVSESFYTVHHQSYAGGSMTFAL